MGADLSSHAENSQTLGNKRHRMSEFKTIMWQCGCKLEAVINTFFRDVSTGEAARPQQQEEVMTEFLTFLTFAAFSSSSFPSKAQLNFNFWRNKSHNYEK